MAPVGTSLIDDVLKSYKGVPRSDTSCWTEARRLLELL
jgi:hypothetical protein